MDKEILKNDLDIQELKLMNFINLDEKQREKVLHWRNDKDIRTWMYNDHEISIEEHNGFIENLRVDFKNSYWLVKHKEYGDLGVIYLNKIDLKNKNAYLGIYGNPENDVKGKGSMLGKAILTLAFDKLSLHSLKLEVIKDNERALNLYRKLGFSEEGKLREYIFKDDEWKDVIVMGLVNENIPN